MVQKAGAQRQGRSGEGSADQHVDTIETRNLIKRTAADMFAHRGYHATTLRALAAKADMTVGTLYYYFPAKSALLLELMDDAMLPLEKSIVEAVSRADSDPPGALTWMVETFLLGTLERLSTATISETELRALSGSDLRRTLKKRDAYQSAMERVIEEGSRQGVFSVEDVKLTVYAILSMCGGVPRWYRPGGRSSPEAIANWYAKLALRMAGCAAL